jgi:hypothetical protein
MHPCCKLLLYIQILYLKIREKKETRAGILKLLRSPGINSKESIPPALVALWAAKTTLSYSVPSPQKLFYKLQHRGRFLKERFSWKVTFSAEKSAFRAEQPTFRAEKVTF